MKIIVIGSGVGGLGAACLLAKGGHKVTVVEKNADFGGRNGQFTEKGFTFPYGPTWYLMPQAYERFFKQMGTSVKRQIKLKRLNPYFRAYFKNTLIQPIDITGNIIQDARSLESLEPGARQKLVDYLTAGEQKYDIATKHFIYRNYSSPFELFRRDNFSLAMKSGLTRNMYDHAGQYFVNEQVKELLSFPAVFIGTSPFEAPSVYSLLNHASFNQGVFYPEGGMFSITSKLIKLAKKHGVVLKSKAEVKKIITVGDICKGVLLKSGKILESDAVISNAGMAHTELNLLDPGAQSHSRRFWKRKQYSPSAVIVYLGVNGKIKSPAYHNLIFAGNWRKQFDELKSSKKFPSDPSIYVCNLSLLDPKCAPKKHGALMAIIPVAREIPYTKTGLENFTDQAIKTIGKHLAVKDLGQKVVYRKIFAGNDFKRRYGSFEGSMLGLNHTLTQTGPFRPGNKSKKLNNLYYVGGDTVPGIGVPMCLISAELAAKRIIQG